VWDSRVLAKLRKNEPVVCAKQNIANPWITETVGLAGYDFIWLCMEHCTGDYGAVEQCIRAAKLHGMDAMVRVNKSGYSDVIKPLELGATGLMYPHCMDGEEAANAVRMARFQPIGRRAIDGGNLDGEFCSHTLADYIAHANEHTFLIAQIEDKEAIEHVDAIVGTHGLDAVFIGTGDLSHSLGTAGQYDNPEIVRTIDTVAEACKKHGKHWGLPVSMETIKQYYDMGARFFAAGADVVGLRLYYRDCLEATRAALA